MFISLSLKAYLVKLQTANKVENFAGQEVDGSDFYDIQIYICFNFQTVIKSDYMLLFTAP